MNDMYCHHCGKLQTEIRSKCPACGQVLDTEFSPSPAAQAKPKEAASQTPFSRPARRLKVLIAVICIPALILVAILIYNNSGTYQTEFIGQYYKIVYHGNLKKLVENDYGLLQRFLKAEKFDGLIVTTIECNDYLIKSFHYGPSYIIDIMDDSITFFESGLQEYNINTAGTYYDRFRDDFEFEIYNISPLRKIPIIGELFDSGQYHEYYFRNRDDVITWLLRIT